MATRTPWEIQNPDARIGQCTDWADNVLLFLNTAHVTKTRVLLPPSSAICYDIRREEA